MSLRVLVTNDDGIDAPGLHALTAAVAEQVEVRVFAPITQASGTGAGLTSEERDGQVPVQRRGLAGLAGVEAYGVSGHPGFIALAAMTGRFGPPPDVVLSGINDGANVGSAILHSGTLGAAMVAGMHGARAMAVSMAVDDADAKRCWRSPAEVARLALPVLLDAPGGTVLNVNVPNVEPGELKPLRGARLSRAGIVQTVHRFLPVTAASGSGSEPEPPRSVQIGGVTADDTDVALLGAGHPTVTSLRIAEDDDLGLPARWEKLWATRR